jgi:hypothetical protein
LPYLKPSFTHQREKSQRRAENFLRFSHVHRKSFHAKERKVFPEGFTLSSRLIPGDQKVSSEIEIPSISLAHLSTFIELSVIRFRG